MKKFKRILLVILLIGMVFLLTGCGDDEDNTVNKKSNDTTNNTNSTANTTSSSSSSNEISTFLSNLADLTEDEILANAEIQMAEPEDDETVAIFNVEGYGQICVKFFEDVAPLAVENFITHSEEGYYDGLTFHRIIEEFMIQGGDPNGNGTGGETIWGEGISEELSETILPYRGALCMASSGTGTSTIGSQFFIVTKNYDEAYDSYLSSYGYSNLLNAKSTYGGSLFLLAISYQYTTFGQVIYGLDVLDEIAAVETDEDDKPVEDVVISSIDIMTYSEAKLEVINE